MSDKNSEVPTKIIVEPFRLGGVKYYHENFVVTITAERDRYREVLAEMDYSYDRDGWPVCPVCEETEYLLKNLIHAPDCAKKEAERSES